MLITIGKVLKPWGVRGELKIEPLTDHLGRFRSLTRVVLTMPDGQEQECAVRSVRYQGETPFLLLRGYDSPEQTAALTGALVRIPEEEAVPLPEGRYYWFELLGMEVFSEAGERLGTIVDIFETGSNDVYVLKHECREVYLPATAEVVREIDREHKRMVIRLMEGLME